MKCVLYCLLFATVLVGVAAKDWTVKVKGQVICGRRSIQDAKVELREYDMFDPDDLLNSTMTNNEGNFMLEGFESEIRSITPYVRVTHHCDAKKNCHRLSDYYIPEKAINSGKTFDMSYINLNILGDSDKEVCN